MEKIGTDYKQQNWKVKLTFSNPYNRDVAQPFKEWGIIFCLKYTCMYSNIMLPP